MTAVSSIDLRNGVVRLAHGERVPITSYFGAEDEAPEDNEDVRDFNWVHSVVAGPTAEGQWVAVLVTDEDKAEVEGV